MAVTGSKHDSRSAEETRRGLERRSNPSAGSTAAPVNRLRLGAGLEARLSTLVCAGYPEETCGLLLGRRNAEAVEVLDLLEVRNLNRERAHDRYELDPDGYAAADMQARERRCDIVGIWHSHPNHPARPSATDRARAWEGWSYVIVSVNRDGMADLRSWRLHEGEFIEEVVE